eukprot:TRINITY_DN54943_c0_g1_i1.p1 TRINITY_DN54943_c0_g1~~TRINITY_DN54943_c0_g1_i1.p1  ORF type:complete len:882 (-),score=299.44 TRINITY_DN54943_c0_g1_i1:28-2463(-)
MDAERMEMTKDQILLDKLARVRVQRRSDRSLLNRLEKVEPTNGEEDRPFQREIYSLYVREGVRQRVELEILDEIDVRSEHAGRKFIEKLLAFHQKEAMELAFLTQQTPVVVGKEWRKGEQWKEEKGGHGGDSGIDGAEWRSFLAKRVRDLAAELRLEPAQSEESVSASTKWWDDLAFSAQDSPDRTKQSALMSLRDSVRRTHDLFDGLIEGCMNRFGMSVDDADGGSDADSDSAGFACKELVPKRPSSSPAHGDGGRRKERIEMNPTVSKGMQSGRPSTSSSSSRMITTMGAGVVEDDDIEDDENVATEPKKVKMGRRKKKRLTRKKGRGEWDGRFAAAQGDVKPREKMPPVPRFRHVKHDEVVEETEGASMRTSTKELKPRPPERRREGGGSVGHGSPSRIRRSLSSRRPRPGVSSPPQLPLSPSGRSGSIPRVRSPLAISRPQAHWKCRVHGGGGIRRLRSSSFSSTDGMTRDEVDDRVNEERDILEGKGRKKEVRVRHAFLRMIPDEKGINYVREESRTAAQQAQVPPSIVTPKDDEEGEKDTFTTPPRSQSLVVSDATAEDGTTPIVSRTKASMNVVIDHIRKIRSARKMVKMHRLRKSEREFQARKEESNVLQKLTLGQIVKIQSMVRRYIARRRIARERLLASLHEYVQLEGRWKDHRAVWAHCSPLESGLMRVEAEVLMREAKIESEAKKEHDRLDRSFRKWSDRVKKTFMSRSLPTDFVPQMDERTGQTYYLHIGTGKFWDENPNLHAFNKVKNAEWKKASELLKTRLDVLHQHREDVYESGQRAMDVLVMDIQNALSIPHAK